MIGAALVAAIPAFVPGDADGGGGDRGSTRPRRQDAVTIPADTAPKDIQRLVASVGNGGRIRFEPGIHRIDPPLRISNKEGITIEGEDGAWLEASRSQRRTPPPLVPPLDDCDASLPCIWPGRGSWKPLFVSPFETPLVSIETSRNITLDSVNIRKNWPNHVMASHVQGLQIRNGRFVGGTNVLVAEGLETRNLRLVGNSWTQDVSGTLWSSLDWAQAHHGIHAYFNGAFLQGRDLGPGITIRDNEIRNAFNGIRIKVRESSCLLSEDADKTDCPHNHDILVEGNFFERISDNAFEPENFAKNVTIRGNTFRGFNGALSLDGVQVEGMRVSRNIFSSVGLPRQSLPEQHCSDWRHDRIRAIKADSGTILSDVVVDDNEWPMFHHLLQRSSLYGGYLSDRYFSVLNTATQRIHQSLPEGINRPELFRENAPDGHDGPGSC